MRAKKGRSPDIGHCKIHPRKDHSATRLRGISGEPRYEDPRATPLNANPSWKRSKGKKILSDLKNAASFPRSLISLGQQRNFTGPLIKSRTTNYLNAKLPWLYRLSEIFAILFFMVWILGILFWIFLLTKQQTFGMVFWIFGWAGLGCMTFVLSFWSKLGTQTISITSRGFQIMKNFGPVKFAKTIPQDRIHSIGFRLFEPYNPLTGNSWDLDKQLGWLLINGEPRTYLYEKAELENFIVEWKKHFG